MANKKVPYYLIEMHKTYTTEELSKLLGVCRQTIRVWRKQGLSVIKVKPLLFKGKVVKTYLSELRKKNKTTLDSDENYCLKCRKGSKIVNVIYAERGRLSKDNVQIVRQGVCQVCGTKTSRLFTKQG